MCRFLACEIDRKDVYLEPNKTHCRDYRDCSDRTPDPLLCESARRRIWWRIFQRFTEQWRPREHGEPWISHL